MHRVASVLAVLTVAAAVAVPASASARRPLPNPWVTLAHETVAGTELTLSVVGDRLFGPARHRDAQFAVDDQPPERQGPDGEEESEDGSASIIHRVAERGRPPLAVDISETPTCRLAVLGTATPAVATVVVLRADGTTTTVRLRAAPSGWHYRGHLFGTFVRTNGSPARSVRALDRAGRLLRAVKLPSASADCAPASG